MSIIKVSTILLAIISVTAILQFAHAQDLLSSENNTDTHNQIVNIVDPALIAGTEVLIEDL